MNSIPAPRPVRLAADPLPKGMAFARAAIARAHGRTAESAAKYAEAKWGENCLPSRILKATVPALSGGEIAGDVVAASVEFMSAVRERSAIGKIPGLRRRPVHTRYLVNTGTVTGNWVAEGDAIPVLPFSFDQANLGLLKVASIIVLTDEELEATDAASEAGIRRDLVDGLAAAMDTAFLDPANSGVAGQTPASITNGLTPVAVGTGDEEDVRDALATMIASFEGDLTQAVFIGRPELFAYLNGLGYDEVGVRGGTLVGAPALASNGLPDAGGFYQLALVDPRGIAYADDGTRAEISSSKQAVVELRTDPTGSAINPTGANLISLFQCNSTALKALAYANWSVEQANAVVLGAFVPVAAAS